MLVEIKNIWENVSLSKKECWIVDELSEPIIFFLLKGSIQLTINDTDIYIINRNEMLMLPNTNLYKIEAITQSVGIVCSLSVEFLLSEKIILEEQTSKNDNQKKIINKLPISENIFQFLLLLRKCMREKFVSQYYFNLKRNELNLLLFMHYNKRELAQFFENALSKDIQFKQFVLNNYLRVKNVQELAALANFSTSGFIKKFQRVFDESPYKWIQKQKAAKILIEINRGVKPLQEIANEYKFSSYQHFSGFCKATFGSPPVKIYKKNLKNET